MTTSCRGTAGSSAGPPSGPAEQGKAPVRLPHQEHSPRGPADDLGVQRHDDPADRFAMGIEDLVNFWLSVRCPHNHCCTSKLTCLQRPSRDHSE